jgi:LmbE family N-acetylglucosaminyl deacetylase
MRFAHSLGKVAQGLRILWLPAVVGVHPVSAAGPTASATSIRQVSNSGIDVVVVAHADDWQIFFGDVIVDRIKSGRRPVFIYLTAGDHGRDSAYWQQRETAALQSTRIASSSPSTTREECAVVRVGQHPVRRCRLGLTESFFLRLPDGNRNGAGFARNGFESLRKLRVNRTAQMHSLDSTTTYSSWQDLTATVNGLVRMVADSMHAADIVLRTTDPSVRINPHDHYDHRIAGKLTETLLKSGGWSGRYYIGYALATRAPNRTTVQRQQKVEVFSAYNRAMMQVNPKWSAYGEHPGFYTECMQRTYARSINSRSLTARSH